MYEHYNLKFGSESLEKARPSGASLGEEGKLLVEET